MSKGSAIFGWVRLLAPMILANIPATSKIAGQVSVGLDEAEAIHGGGTGAEKLQHVINIGREAASAVNAERPGTIDPNTVESAITEGVNTAFAVAKVVHDAHGPAVGAVAVPAAAEVAPIGGGRAGSIPSGSGTGN